MLKDTIMSEEDETPRMKPRQYELSDEVCMCVLNIPDYYITYQEWLNENDDESEVESYVSRCV